MKRVCVFACAGGGVYGVRFGQRGIITAQLRERQRTCGRGGGGGGRRQGVGGSVYDGRLRRKKGRPWGLCTVSWTCVDMLNIHTLNSGAIPMVSCHLSLVMFICTTSLKMFTSPICLENFRSMVNFLCHKAWTISKVPCFHCLPISFST